VLEQGPGRDSVVWGLTEIEGAAGMGQEAQGGRLEDAVVVWDVMGEKVW